MLAQRAKFAAHAEEKGSGAITGTVDGFDGQPVTGACVTAVGDGHSVTTTDAPDGTFRLFGLAAGSYALEYRDCASADQYLTTWSGGVSSQKAATRVQIAVGQVRHVPVMTLRPVNTEAAIAAGQASFQRTLAANNRSLTAAAAAKTGKISGTVTGKGKPLSGICVEALGIRIGGVYGAKTAKNGTYTVRNVRPGKYEVVFAPSFSCRNHTNWLQQIYKNDTTVSALFTGKGTHVPVRAHHTTSGISGNLKLGGEITGTVKGKSGAKARGICVTADGQFPHHQRFEFEGQTGANGSYKLHALFPGKYTLQFSIGCGSRSENYAPTTHRAVKLRLGQGITVNQVLPIGASISGTVRLGTSSGTPLKGICVFGFRTRGFNGGNATTNRDGRYRILGLVGGKFQLQFFPCNNGNYTSALLTAHTTAGHPTSGVNAVLQTGATISGTIKDTDGKPVSGICVEVLSSSPAGDFGFGLDNKGSYSVDQLPAGTYQAGYISGCGNKGSYATTWYNNQPSESTATSINLTTGPTIRDVFTANIVLQPGATITGKVTNIHGAALSNICVDAASQSDAALGGYFEALTFTRHGSYTMSNLSPGQYLINFGCEFGPAKYADQWFRGAPDAGAADLLSVPAGQTSVNAVLQPAGSIAGVVTGKGGHPLENVCVAAVNTKGTPPALSGGGASGFVGSLGSGPGATTNKTGHYRITGLAAGRYQVSFSQCFGSSRYAEQWFRGKASAQAANAVTVRTGKSTSGIDGRLTLGGSISGRVVNGSGKGLRNICIVAAAGSAGQVAEAMTTRAGTYSIPALGSGQYTVEFSPCGSQNLITAVAHVRVTAPHVTAGVNATMQPGGSIAGTVTAGSAAVSNACVEVYSASSAEPVAFGMTGVGGNYVATGLPAGSYTVYFNDPNCLTAAPGLAPQWYNGQATQATAKSVPVTVGNTTPSVDAALQPDGEITGTVSASGSATPLSGACITAFPQSANGSLPVVAVSSATGYTLADMLPGQYKVRFSAGCGATGYATQSYPKIITVVANQTVSGISATLNKSG
jgi:protocatechuate 3,4-dioxygenase beta subunit